MPNDTRVERRFLFGQSLTVSIVLFCCVWTVHHSWMQNLTAFSIHFSVAGHLRLCFLIERIPGEVSDSNKLPSPNFAMPSYRRAAQPTHVERGGTQPDRGPFCSGPHGRLTDDIPPLWKTSFPPLLNSPPALFFVCLMAVMHKGSFR